MKTFNMDIKRVGVLNPERCETVQTVYGEPTEQEKQAFIEHLKGLDFSAAGNQELECKLSQDVWRVIIAVIVGWTYEETVLFEARSYFGYFMEDMAEARAASA